MSEKDANIPTSPLPPPAGEVLQGNVIPKDTPDEELENYDPILSDDIDVVRKLAFELREANASLVNSASFGAAILFSMWSPSGTEYKYTVHGINGAETTRHAISTVAAAKHDFQFSVKPPNIIRAENQARQAAGSFQTQTVPPAMPAQPGTGAPPQTPATGTMTPPSPSSVFPPAPPVSSPTFVPPGAVVGEKVQVTLISHELSRNNKHCLNVKGVPVQGGKPYTQFGLTAWPEVIPQDAASFETWPLKSTFAPPASMAFAYTDGKKILRFSAS